MVMVSSVGAGMINIRDHNESAPSHRRADIVGKSRSRWPRERGSSMEIRITVNGAEHPVTADDGRSLLEVLRDDLGITGPKLGCGEGACGACTVLIGRRPVTSCITPAAEAAGQRVTTVQALAEDGILHPVQQAWLEAGARQCGYCTPGLLTGYAALLHRPPR